MRSFSEFHGPKQPLLCPPVYLTLALKFLHMRLSSLLMFALLNAIAFTAFGQGSEDASNKDSTKPPSRSEQFLLDITWDGLLNAPDSMDLKLWSRGVNVYAMYICP